MIPTGRGFAGSAQSWLLVGLAISCRPAIGQETSQVQAPPRGSDSTAVESGDSKLLEDLRAKVLSNHMDRARSFADSLLAVIPAGDPSRDSVQSMIWYLDDIRTRTAPPRPRRPWNIEVDFSTGHLSFRSVPIPSEDPTDLAVHSMGTASASGLSEWFHTHEAKYGILVPGALAIQRLELRAEVETGLMDPKPDWRSSTCSARWSALRNTASLSGEGLMQFDRSGLRIGKARTDLVWTSGFGPTITLSGGWSTYPEVDLEIRDGTIGFVGKVPQGNSSLGWFLQSGVQRRMGILSGTVPAKTATCTGIQQGAPADPKDLVCYTGPDLDSAVLPGFKGLSGLPYSATDPVRTAAWTQQLRVAGGGSWSYEGSEKGWSLQVGLGLEGDAALEPTEWNNASIGNREGVVLFVFRDKATGAESLWEKQGNPDRFLPLMRHRKAMRRLQSSLYFRPGLRPVPRLELRLETAIWRGWSNLPAESGEDGFVGWQVGAGGSWTF